MASLESVGRLVSVGMTLADYATDLIALEKWYRLGHTSWFGLGIVFLIMSNIVSGIWACGGPEDVKRAGVVLHFLGLGIIYDYFANDDFTGTKGIECVFEAGPFALIQTYVIIVEDEYGLETFISTVVSFVSIGVFAARGNHVGTDEIEHASPIMLIMHCLIFAFDAAGRVIPFAFFLKACTSIMIRLFVIAGISVAYFLGIFYHTDKDVPWRPFFVIFKFACYLIFSNIENDAEPPLRHALSIAFLIYAFHSSVIHIWLFVLGATVCGIFIAWSIWKLLVDKFANKLDDKCANKLEMKVDDKITLAEL